MFRGAEALTYDINSNVLTTTATAKPGSPLSPLVTTATYDPTYNNPLTVTDPLGLVATMTYDPATGNLLSATADSAHLKATTRYTYNGVGLPLTITDPVGTVTQNVYDGFANRTSTTQDAGPGRLNLTTSFTYNGPGDVLTVTDPRGAGFTTTNTYDFARRLLTTTSPATAAAPSGIVTAYSYDPAGRVLQARQSSGGSILRTVSATYTLTGNTATTTDANAHTTTYAYDALDRRTGTTDAVGRVTQYGYDTLNRPVAVANPGISTSPLAQQGYTPNGRRASLTDANTNVVSFAYDGFDRLSTTTYPGASTETYAYDFDSNVTSRQTRASATIAYAYDTLNRLITKTPPSPWPVVSYTYDLAGRSTGVSDTSAAIAAVSTSGIQYTTSTTYDALNNPTGVSWTPAPTAAVPAAASSVVFNHIYNAVNQRIGQTVTDPSSNVWISYPAATPVTTSYTANNLNQYTAVASASPTYDGNGNTTYDGSTYTFGYDPENRLVSVSGAGNTASYAFDGRGRRKLKTVNGTTTISITDAQNREVLEYDGTSGAIQRWYAYGRGPNAVLNQMNVSAGTRSTLLADIQGSIIGMMDSSTATLSSFAYRPYGSSTIAPATFGYTGQRIDAESGLYYYRARHYSPGWGRFLQADPIKHVGGMHLYAYVSNDPLNSIDPRGFAGIANDTTSESSTNFLVAGATSTSGLAANGDVTGALNAAPISSFNGQLLPVFNAANGNVTGALNAAPTSSYSWQSFPVFNAANDNASGVLNAASTPGYSGQPLPVPNNASSVSDDAANGSNPLQNAGFLDTISRCLIYFACLSHPGNADEDPAEPPAIPIETPNPVQIPLIGGLSAPPPKR